MQIEPSKMLYSMELLAQRCAAHHPLSPAERAILCTQQHRSQLFRAGSHLPGAAEALFRPRLIVSGWACRERIMKNGRRQLLAILLPGDLIGGLGNPRPLDSVDAVAITNVRLIEIGTVIRLVADQPDEYPGIAVGLYTIRAAEERCLLDHLVRLGSQPALQRTASFLLELHERCRMIGFVNGGCFSMPLTQELMGNALGLSMVHINRVMRQLRSGGLIDTSAGLTKILDIEGLAAVADLVLANNAPVVRAEDVCLTAA